MCGHDHELGGAGALPGCLFLRLLGSGSCRQQPAGDPRTLPQVEHAMSPSAWASVARVHAFGWDVQHGLWLDWSVLKCSQQVQSGFHREVRPGGFKVLSSCEHTVSPVEAGLACGMAWGPSGDAVANCLLSHWPS